MFTRSTWVMVLALFAAAGSAQAVPTYLTFTGEIINANPNASKTFFGDFINGIDESSTYNFTFVYDSDTITPDVNSGTPTQGTALYSSSIALVSGRAGTFTDFAGWSLRAFFGSATTHRGTQDYFEIKLDGGGGRTVFLNINYGDDGAGFAGEDAWDSPFPFPTTDELNTPSIASTAIFDSRYYNSGLGRQIYYIYNGGDGFAAPAPEPTAAVAMIGLLGAMRMRRRRSV